MLGLEVPSWHVPPISLHVWDHGTQLPSTHPNLSAEQLLTAKEKRASGIAKECKILRKTPEAVHKSSNQLQIHGHFRRFNRSSLYSSYRTLLKVLFIHLFIYLFYELIHDFTFQGSGPLYYFLIIFVILVIKYQWKFIRLKIIRLKKTQYYVPQLFSSEPSLQFLLPLQSIFDEIHSPLGHKNLVETHLHFFSSDLSLQWKSPSHRIRSLMQNPLSHWNSFLFGHWYPAMIIIPYILLRWLVGKNNCELAE